MPIYQSPWGKSMANAPSAREAAREIARENDPTTFKNRRKAHAAQSAAARRRAENARKAAQKNARQASRAAAKRRGGK